MNSLLIYIMLTSICLSLFVLAYQIFLRDNTRFNLCRFYLISAILLSFLLPSIPIDLGICLIHKEELKTPQIKIEAIALSSSQGIVKSAPIESGSNLNIDYISIIAITLISISILLLLRFIYRFGSIILIQTSGNRSENDEGFNLIFTDRTDNAFSFLGYIFINPLKFNDEEKRLIIEHEREHIRHFHSIDLILIELLIVMQWFNPFAYIARRKLIEIHEFIADNGVIRNGADPYSYQTLLLSVVTSSCLPQVGNQLSALITKKRIAMIGKPMNQTGQWINFLILVPIAAILVIGISAFTVKESKNIETKEDIIIPESQKYLLRETDSKINKPIAIENKNYSTLHMESENSRLERFDLKPISRKEVELLSQNQKPAKEEKLNIALKGKDVHKSIRAELLKRAEAENKYTYLKDLYFNLPPNGYSPNLFENVTSRYSVILKKECIYSIEYLSGSKGDNLEAIVGTEKGDESIIVNHFNFSYRNKIIITPETTGPYHLEIRNLASEWTEALIYLTLIEYRESSIKVSEQVYKSELSEKKFSKNNNVELTDTLGEVFMVVEQIPTFGSGKEDEFKNWLISNMQYPKEAAEKGIQGKVYVQFIIEKDGRITNAKVIRSVNPLLDKEAIRLVESSPKWNPGMQRGNKVRVQQTFPVTFSIQ